MSLRDDYFRWERTGYGRNDLGTTPCPVCQAEVKWFLVRKDTEGREFRRYLAVHSSKRHREMGVPAIGATTQIYGRRADGSIYYRDTGDQGLVTPPPVRRSIGPAS